MNILTKTFTEHKKAATIGVIAAALVLTTGVGVACKGYIDNQAQVKKQAIENQKKLENEKIAKQAAEEEAKKKAAAEEAAKAAAASQPPAEAAPAPKPAPTTTKPKPAEPAKKTETKSYETVSVSVNGSLSGSSVTASAVIGSSKAGTCTYTFYQKSPSVINLGSQTTSANGGSCPSVSFSTTEQPSGTYKVYVDYKANDYSAKGSGYYMFNL